METNATRIAVLGTGLLGSAMVRRFRKQGFDVIVWNRTAAKAKALETEGAKAASAPAEAVKDADHIHVVLSEDSVVDSLLDQIVPSLKRGAILIDHSTTSPGGTKARAEAMQ